MQEMFGGTVSNTKSCQEKCQNPTQKGQKKKPSKIKRQKKNVSHHY